MDASQEGAYYLPPPDNQIVMSPDFVQYHDVGLREYTYYFLNAVNPTESQKTPVQGLESGLADYFPSSFNGNSDFGKEIFADMAKKNPGITIPSRNLDNRHSFSEIQPGKTELHDEGTIWGGAYWQMRTSIGAGGKRQTSSRSLEKLPHGAQHRPNSIPPRTPAARHRAVWRNP